MRKRLCKTPERWFRINQLSERPLVHSSRQPIAIDMATLPTFLEKGYFPRELPPPFNTESFAIHGPGLAASWNKSTRTLCGAHNLARPGGLRRPLKIPNPFAYLALAEIISNNWTSLLTHTWQVRFSASRPYSMTTSPRAVVSRYSFSELPRIRALRRRGTRYLLRADINQFYPALYTHTVPWALHTKLTCKTALTKKNKGNHLLGNQIDKALQCLNDGQTHGIPIGPDISLVVAEVLLAAVDQELFKRCPGLIRGFRYADDYELSFSKLSDAERVLTELQSILSAYELTLNPRKTRVDELPEPLVDTWGSELGRYLIRKSSSPVGQRNDLIGLFSRALEIASNQPEESVLRYAVARVQNEKVHVDGWRTFQNCVLGVVSADPSTIAVALGTLHKVASFGGHSISKSPLTETFEGIIESHARRGDGSEVAWALWGALAWDLPISAASAQSVSAMEDDIVALLALDANERGLFPAGALDTQVWTTIVNQPGVLKGEHWLLAYEANQRGWLLSPDVVADPTFSAMSQAAVNFYDPARNTPQFPPAAKGIPGGRLPAYYG